MYLLWTKLWCPDKWRAFILFDFSSSKQPCTPRRLRYQDCYSKHLSMSTNGRTLQCQICAWIYTMLYQNYSCRLFFQTFFSLVEVPSHVWKHLLIMENVFFCNGIYHCAINCYIYTCYNFTPRILHNSCLQNTVKPVQSSQNLSLYWFLEDNQSAM